MAQIKLKEILGTDNIALSRTDMNKNFQTLENSINTLETFLNTSVPGAGLSVGNLNIALSAGSSVTDILFNNAGSSRILGNLTVNQDISCINNINVSNSLSVTSGINFVGSSNSTSSMLLGSSNKVIFNIKNAVLIDEQLASVIPTIANTEDASSTKNIATQNLRSLLLDYRSLNLNNPSEGATVISLDQGVLGQRLHISILGHGDPTAVNSFIHFSTENFNSKYNLLSDVTTYKGDTTVPVALTIEGANTQDYERQYIELIYKSNGWEVYNSHPLVKGI